MNYLDLSNVILRELGEVPITTTSSQVGFQRFIVDGVNRAIRDVDGAYFDWPHNYSAQTDATVPGQAEYAWSTTLRRVDINSFILVPTDLVTNGQFTSDISSWTDNSSANGTTVYSATGNGRLSLTPGSSGIASAYQALDTTSGAQYRVYVRTVTGSTAVVGLKLGTTAGGTEIGTQSLTTDSPGDGAYNSFTFNSTATTTYLTLHSSVASVTHDVDRIQVFEDMQPVELNHLSNEEWNSRFSEDERLLDPSSFGVPASVSFTKNNKYRLGPLPDKTKYTVEYDGWLTPTTLSSSGDTPDLPDRFDDVLINRVLYYAHRYRSDHQAAATSLRDYQSSLKSARTELINEEDYMLTDVIPRQRYI